MCISLCLNGKRHICSVVIVHLTFVTVTSLLVICAADDNHHDVFTARSTSAVLP